MKHEGLVKSVDGDSSSILPTGVISKLLTYYNSIPIEGESYMNEQFQD